MPVRLDRSRARLRPALAALLFLACAPAGSDAGEVDPGVAFPQFRERSDELPAALLEGTLSERDGCLRVVSPGTPAGHLVLWQAGYRPRRAGERLEIVDAAGTTIARVGDRVALAGGEVPLWPELLDRLARPIPGRCKGPYWLGGPLEQAK